MKTSNHDSSNSLTKAELLDLIKPNSALEKSFFDSEEYIKGLNWGVPRKGHPEGKVAYHILEVLNNITIYVEKAHQIVDLRIITLVHDSFKHLQDRSVPRDWNKHHGYFAMKFLEKYLPDNEVLLNIVRYHDEVYYAWREKAIYRDQDATNQRLNHLIKNVGIENMELFTFFFKCDTSTGDKDLNSLLWYMNEIYPQLKNTSKEKISI